MKKIAMSITYKSQNFISDYQTYNKLEEEKLQRLAKLSAEGKISYLQISRDNKVLYFPKSILDKSIVSLIYDNTPDS